MVVEIEDNGFGVEEKEIPFLFEQFFRSKSKAVREQQGTGLGLAIVDKIVRAHGGKLEVKSQLGAGTTFSVFINRPTSSFEQLETRTMHNFSLDPSEKLCEEICGGKGIRYNWIRLPGIGERGRRKCMEFNIQDVDAIIDHWGPKPASLLQIMLDINHRYHYLPHDSLSRVSERLKMPVCQVYSVANFFKVFSLTPRGRSIMHVCTGTACHVKGTPNCSIVSNRNSA